MIRAEGRQIRKPNRGDRRWSLNMRIAEESHLFMTAAAEDMKVGDL